MARLSLDLVMPGLVPGIHVFVSSEKTDVDGRDKPGHDDAERSTPQLLGAICDCPATRGEGGRSAYVP
jgi:hypothetical protein